MRGRGCGFAVLWFGLSALPVAAAEVPVPSGQLVTLSEVLLDEAPGELWVRFRFLAPQIARDGGDVDYELAGHDMDHLCDQLALPYLAHYELDPARVVISLSDRAVDYREVDYTVPCTVIMGNEVDGVSERAADQADEHIVIPMMGMVESLNV